MFESTLKELELISQAVGNSPDLVQGGGGNTSVKLDDEYMAVKASGFRLNQITSKDGFVVVNYKNIKDYYHSVDLASDTDFEKESVEFVKQNIRPIEGGKNLRPSVEAGFHSILKKYVIHTHPVYANILCCSQNGSELTEKIFSGKDYEFIWIPYINPGFCLTLKINEALNKCIAEKGKFPGVIFMENHGLIVSDDDSQKCIELHEEVNRTIREYLGINEVFPAIDVKRMDEDIYVSNTPFVGEFFKSRGAGLEYLEKTVLYPDQLVYLNSNLGNSSNSGKLSLDPETKNIVYRTNYSEAKTIEETLTAYLYVISQVEAQGLSIKCMNEKEIDFIKNWESEAYRKSLVKELNK